MKKLLPMLLLLICFSAVAQNTFKVTYDFSTDKSATVSGATLISAQDAVSGSVNGKITASVVENDGGTSVFKNTVFENNATNYQNAYMRMDLTPAAGKSVRITKITVTQRGSIAGGEGAAYVYRIGCTKDGAIPQTGNRTQSTDNIRFLDTYHTTSFLPGLGSNSADDSGFLSVWLAARCNESTGTGDQLDWYVDKIVVEGVEATSFDYPAELGQDFSASYEFTGGAMTPTITGTTELSASDLMLRAESSETTDKGYFWLHTWAFSNSVGWGNVYVGCDLTPNDGYQVLLKNYEFVHAGSGVAGESRANRLAIYHADNADGTGAVNVVKDAFTSFSGRDVFGDDVADDAFNTTTIADDLVFDAQYFFRFSYNRIGKLNGADYAEYWTVDKLTINGSLVSDAKANLLKELKAGEALLNSSAIGELYGEYTWDVYSAFKEKINSGLAVLKKADATEAEFLAAAEQQLADNTAYAAAANSTPTWSVSAISSDWSDPLNWASGMVPAATDNIIISSYSAVFPEIDETDLACNNLTVLPGATISFAEGGFLAVIGTYTNTNDNPTKMPVKVTLDNLSHVYDGTAKTLSYKLIPDKDLAVVVTYAASTTAPTEVGNYNAEVKVNEALYEGEASAVFSISDEVVEAVAITFGDANFTYTGEKQLPAITTDPADIDYTLTIEDDKEAIDAGTYNITVTINQNGYVGEKSTSFTIAKAPMTITLANLSQAYDGTAKEVSYSLSPDVAVEAVTLTYNNESTAPTEAGTYTVVATITDTNYEGSVIETLEITNLPTAITDQAKRAIRLYPSPNQGAFWLETESKSAVLQIYAQNGKLVYTNTLSTPKTWVQLPENLAGTYILQLVEEGRVLTNQKFVIQK